MYPININIVILFKGGGSPVVLQLRMGYLNSARHYGVWKGIITKSFCFPSQFSLTANNNPEPGRQKKRPVMPTKTFIDVLHFTFLIHSKTFGPFELLSIRDLIYLFHHFCVDADNSSVWSSSAVFYQLNYSFQYSFRIITFLFICCYSTSILKGHSCWLEELGK